MSDLGTPVPGESEGSSMAPSVAYEQKVERAKKMGWKPVTEFKGDPADFIDAPEFLAREPLLEEIRGLKKHIKQSREQTDRDMQVITKQFSQMSQLAYDKALKDLEARRDYAIENNDPREVRELDKEIDKVKEDHREAQQVAKQQQVRQVATNEELEAWRRENTWFDKDQELQDEAVAIGVGYMAKYPNRTQSQMLQHVEDRIKRIYPEKFKPTVKESTTVEDEDNQRVESRSSTPSLGKKGSKLSVRDLDDDERSIMNTLIKRNVLKDIAAKNNRTQQEEFLAQLAERKAKQ